MYHFERYVPHKLGNRKNEVVDTALTVLEFVIIIYTKLGTNLVPIYLQHIVYYFFN